MYSNNGKKWRQLKEDRFYIFFPRLIKTEDEHTYIHLVMLSESFLHLSPLFIVIICSILFAFFIEYLRKYIRLRQERERIGFFFQIENQLPAYESLFV